jgi:uncharacterized Ntn-hydrolase superfamily protein
MTLSIAARLPEGNMFGVAIASSSPAVAARCAHARRGAGAVATQNITDPSLGPQILDELGRGASARVALEDALHSTPFAAYRQLIVVGRDGVPVVHSGAKALGIVGTAVGANAAAAGNLLARADVPAVMVAAFEAHSGAHGAGADVGATTPFGVSSDAAAVTPFDAAGSFSPGMRSRFTTERTHFAAMLLQALRAGVAAGGEAGPIHSAGLLVVRDVSWPIVDLRVDWADDDPVAKLTALWERYEPQLEDYVRRALDPAAAPSFGVPGDR